MYLISLNPSEEKLAQLLTRDAWTYFNELISKRNLFRVIDVPMMPRGGSLELPDDLEVAQYYADFAERYTEQLMALNIEAIATIESFIAKIEQTTGVIRGMTDNELAYS